MQEVIKVYQRPTEAIGMTLTQAWRPYCRNELKRVQRIESKVCQRRKISHMGGLDSVVTILLQ